MSSPIWWRIVDVSNPMSLILDIITEFTEARNMIISALQRVSYSGWTVLEPPVERCLQSLSKLNTAAPFFFSVDEERDAGGNEENTDVFVEREEGRQIGESAWSMQDDQRAAQIVGHAGRCREQSICRRPTPNHDDKEEDFKNDDVRYVIELLRYTFDMIQKKIRQRENSERDKDIFMNSHTFSCFDGVTDIHFGKWYSEPREVVARTLWMLHAIQKGII